MPRAGVIGHGRGRTVWAIIAAMVQVASLGLHVMNTHCRQVSPGPETSWSRPLLVMLGIGLLALTLPSMACDADADCGVGGACIKREKRASGVCYGGARRSAPSKAETPVQSVVEMPTQPVTGERREHAKAWLGDPEQMIKDNLPGKEVGGLCMVTQDCPRGVDCVIAGFEGHCVKL